tara:strand:- start:3263 stop:3592 length:330 start_codon:yes stop_codon:yes gene_type:complete
MARKPRLGKTERALKARGIEMPSITVFKQKMADDKYGSRPTSDFFSGSGHQVGIGVNTTSTVNALKSVNSLNGEIRYAEQMAKSDENINIPVSSKNQPLFSVYPRELSL